MADGANIKIGGKSAEEIALELTRLIMDKEETMHGGRLTGSRENLLSTYKECLSTVLRPFST